MNKIFISYCHADQPFALRLAAALPALDIEPWIDRDGIHGGSRWSSSVQQALDECEALILVLTPAAMASSNVEDEWQYVMDHGKTVLPVLLLPTDTHFQLSRIQHIDFHSQTFETALTQLADGLGHALESAHEETDDVGSHDQQGGTKLAGQAVGMPIGTVTFLFSDIEGSTERWERDADAMRDALQRHDALMRDAIEGAGGVVFKTVGDAFCAAFGEAGDGLRASIAAQVAISGEDWASFGSDFPPLRVRMALHTGAASLRDDDYFGRSLNRVARLEAAGHGGQILVSLVTQQLLRDHLEEEFVFRDLGVHRLKDLQHSEHIFQVVGPELVDVLKPPRTTGHLEVRDRIVVDESAVARTVPEALHQMLETVRDEALTVSMTPDQLREVASHRPADLTEYRLGRVAAWSQPQFRIDGRFVELSMLIDRGEQSTQGRWTVKDERYDDLLALVEDVPDQALVVLGPPGSGKSTLLRRLELDSSLAALRDENDDERVTFYIELNHFKPRRPGDPIPDPGEWLAESWSLRYPDLPPLDGLIDSGRLLLLLDALNEISVADETEFYDVVGLWKDFVHRTIRRAPANRIVFSCRGLDYSAPLSTPELRVPQVRIEPMTDEQVQHFIRLHSPLHWHEIWDDLDGAPQLELLRSPYFLKLLVEQVEDSGEIPRGRAGLFTGFVRQALRREIERDNPIFKPGSLLSTRDYRRVGRWAWRSNWELPSHGALIPKLFGLAFQMQSGRAEGKTAQLRLEYDEVLDILDDENDENIVRAGLALSVLDEDTVNDEILYIHQLVQEYFAAQRLATKPEAVAELVQVPWRADEVRPSLAEATRRVSSADPLPPMPSSGWEQTAILATAMSEAPDGFIGRIMETNLALAGTCAMQPDVVVGEALRKELVKTLVTRSLDPEADLRARIHAALVLGSLGDPRLEQVQGPNGVCLAPSFVEIAAGDYIIGRDDEDAGDEGPSHRVSLDAFELATSPVTNAEYARFIEAGGYADQAWWDTVASKAWNEGEGTAAGVRRSIRYWRRRYQDKPELLEQLHDDGGLNTELYELKKMRAALDDEAFEAHLRDKFPGGRLVEPSYWRDPAYNQAALPVVGISWFEARAYCLWLSAQTGASYRLPTEVEWEAAARGATGRRYPFGDESLSMSANTIESHIRGTTPPGVFPTGATPEGLFDMTGNVWEWTGSIFGIDLVTADYGYPYDPTDGREDATAGADLVRVARGGSWFHDLEASRPTTRYTIYPDHYGVELGFRLARSG